MSSRLGFAIRRLYGPLGLALVVSFVAGPLVSHATNAQVTPVPLVNPGFEGPPRTVGGCANVTGTVADGWGDNTCWDTTAPKIQYLLDTFDPHGGLTSQRIKLARGGLVQFAQFLSAPFAVGQHYRVSVWLRGAKTKGTHVMLGVREQGAPYRVFGSQFVRVPKAWTRYEFDVVSDDADVVLLVRAFERGTFWVDDAAIVSEPETSTVPTAAVPSNYFGMHTNYLDTPWPAVGDGVGLVRIWDAGENLDGTGAGSQWDDVSPSPGVYDWSGLDARVAAAVAHGADVVYTLGGRTPRWASANRAAASPYGPGQSAPPKNIGLWQQWVRAVATRYRGQIKYWEIWNEPDLAGFYSGTQEGLLALGQAAYQVLKSIDPSNVVLSPGFNGNDGPAYLDFYLANGGGDFADVVAFHNYVDTPEDASRWRVAGVRAVTSRYGQSAKPLWNTEQGWVDDPPAPFSPERSMGYVARSFLLNWAAGFSSYAYYTWDNRSNDILFTLPDRTTLLPAGMAYREIVQWMRGAVMESLTTDPAGNYVAALHLAGGSEGHVVWNPGGATPFQIPSGWGATLQRDLQGNSQPLDPGGQITAGEAPVLLE